VPPERRDSAAEGGDALPVVSPQRVEHRAAVRVRQRAEHALDGVVHGLES
jgi:hypothetical protein